MWTKIMHYLLNMILRSPIKWMNGPMQQQRQFDPRRPLQYTYRVALDKMKGKNIIIQENYNAQTNIFVSQSEYMNQ